MSNKILTHFATTVALLAFSTTAYCQALYITPAGDVGVGTDLPISSLEVTRSDGTSQVLVNETSEEVAPRTLFQLRNPGNTKFGVYNTDADVQWSFANPGTGFRLSRQGSGFVEMEILNNGDVMVAGVVTDNSDRNAKTAITEIDPQDILERVEEMPVSQWEYKDAPGISHIGPMAQDFHAAFGLGRSDKGIATLDTSGVALASIKALSERNTRVEAQNEALKTELATLKQEMQELKAMLLEMSPAVSQN